jgi:hypothetical protein
LAHRIYLSLLTPPQKVIAFQEEPFTVMALIEILINDCLINELSSSIDVRHAVNRAASVIRCIEINQMVAHEKRRSALFCEYLRETAGGMNVE